MDFGYDARTLDLRKQLLIFMDERIYPDPAAQPACLQDRPGRRDQQEPDEQVPEGTLWGRGGEPGERE